MSSRRASDAWLVTGSFFAAVLLAASMTLTSQLLHHHCITGVYHVDIKPVRAWPCICSSSPAAAEKSLLMLCLAAFEGTNAFFFFAPAK
jgi:hypothetical protein